MPLLVEFTAVTSERLDKAVAEHLHTLGENITRSGLKSLGVSITVNGKPQKLSHETRPGDRICLSLPDPQPTEIVPEPMDFVFVHLDEHIAVINKPFGVVVHPAKGHQSGTVVHGLLHALQGRLSSIGGVERPGIVHRLDKDTAGLLIVALTDQAHHRLVSDFQHRRIRKIYHALVKGHPPVEGHIDAPIGRSHHDRKKMAVVQTGKSAISDYRVIEYLKDHALVEVSILTGRTHQIRVHMSHTGYPIAGDPLYSRHHSQYHLPGIALCAKELSFAHPATGQALSFSVDLPIEMEQLLQRLR